METTLEHIDELIIFCIVCLFGLMLYVHGKRLRSFRNGQLSYPHYSWASLPQAGYQYLAHIISPLTDICCSCIAEDDLYKSFVVRKPVFGVSDQV